MLAWARMTRSLRKSPAASNGATVAAWANTSACSPSRANRSLLFLFEKGRAGNPQRGPFSVCVSPRRNVPRLSGRGRNCHVCRRSHHTRKGRRRGNGCLAFRREKFVPKGGPSGGDGGRGGDIVLVGNPHYNTLLHFRFNPEHSAQRGRHGEGSNRTGRNGAAIELPVADRNHRLRRRDGRSAARLHHRGGEVRACQRRPGRTRQSALRHTGESGAHSPRNRAGRARRSASGWS